MLNGSGGIPRTAGDLAKRLNGQRSGDHHMCKCPAHDDRNASLSITQKDGKILLHCHAGCSQKAVIAALRDRGLWPEPSKKPAKKEVKKKDRGRPVETYPYYDADGVLRFEVLRYENKEFPIRRPDGRGGYLHNAPLGRQHRYLLYRLPEVLEGLANEQPIFFVEGEKDVNSAVKELGIVATCNNGGGGKGKWQPEHAEPLKGADVIIVPDNDQKGRDLAEDQTASLSAIGVKRLRVVHLPGLPAKGDISDWIAAGGTAEQLWALVEQTPDWTPAQATPDDKPTAGTDNFPSTWNIAPWPDPVDGAVLADAIVATLERHVQLPDHGAVTIALWILFAHAIDAFVIAAILSVESPEKRCGKTTLLELIELLAPRGYMSANASTATVFRITDKHKPTLILDEAETFLTSDKTELIGILNAGYRRRSAYVDRCEGDKNEVRRFSAWSPKVVGLIGSIGAIRDTLQDRSIPIRMRRKRRDEKLARLRHDRIEEFVALCRQAARWATDNLEALRTADPDVPDELHDRAQDNWRPLIATADRLGGDWPQRARTAARALSGGSEDDEESGGVLLLRHCLEIFENLQCTALEPKELVTHLCANDEWPWKTWRNGREEITPRGVAKILARFQIRSSKSGRRTYSRESFEESWSHYLEPAPPPQFKCPSVQSL
jgi:putative DNA primase/helicase